jgi:N-acetylneuraminate lyase
MKKTFIHFALLLTAATTTNAMLLDTNLNYHLVDPVFTPYYNNRSVNYEVIPKYLQLSVQNEVDVILLGGSTAEWPSLTADERLTLLSVWRKAIDQLDVKDRPKLLFHAGDVSVANAQYLAEKSEEYGADWILLVAPCIMRPPTLDALVDTLSAIASVRDFLLLLLCYAPCVSARRSLTCSFCLFFSLLFSALSSALSNPNPAFQKAPNLPMFYYHYPALYGVDFKMSDFLQVTNLETRLPTLAGVKYIDPDMQTLTLATGAAKSSYVFFNNDPLLAGLAAGSMGAISYTTIFPYARKMQEAFSGGDFAKARDAERTIQEYSAIIGEYGGKPAARVLPLLFGGVDLGSPRAPLLPIASADLSALNASLIQAGFLNGNLKNIEL